MVINNIGYIIYRYYYELVYPIGINIFPIGSSLFPIVGAGPGAGPARSAWPSLTLRNLTLQLFVALRNLFLRLYEPEHLVSPLLYIYIHIRLYKHINVRQHRKILDKGIKYETRVATTLNLTEHIKYPILETVISIKKAFIIKDI